MKHASPPDREVPSSLLDAEQAGLAPLPQATRAIRWRWSLQTFLLALTVVAVWIAFWQTRRENQRLADRIRGMQEIARGLAVADPAQFAVHHQPGTWGDDSQWHVYLPPEFHHTLCLATDGIDSAGFPENAERVEISSGRHHLQLQLHFHDAAQQWLVRVSGDGAVHFRKELPASWWDGRMHSQTGITRSESWPTSQPLVLARRRFHEVASSGEQSSEVTKGILLWIEASPLSSSGAKDEGIPSDW